MAKPAGLYIHIPFCVKKCPYCDFYSVTNTSLIPKFIQAIQREMEMNPFRDITFDTLYLGGGTPSLLSEKDIFQLTNAAQKYFHVLPGSEITIEVNPGTVSPNALKSYIDAGINRLSIGVQSFNNKNLTLLQRIHTENEALTTIRQSRHAGFENISIDLIFGLPGQTKKSCYSDLEKAMDFQPEHISCYMLTFEPGTKMSEDKKKGKLRALPETQVSELFKTTMDFLCSNGYEHYEISNFARIKKRMRENIDIHYTRSRHNQKYWTFTPYIGLGPSAHSYIAPERSWNHCNIKTYIKQIESGHPPVEGKEELTREQMMIETVYLGLRTAEGINIEEFNNKFNSNFHNKFNSLCFQLEADGFLKKNETTIALTQKGVLFIDSIVSKFVVQI